MDAKLTLSLDASVIAEGKAYAKAHDISLSKLIEIYLKFVTQKEVDKIKISPIVEELTGVIQLDENDHKRAYSDYLSKKYS